MLIFGVFPTLRLLGLLSIVKLESCSKASKAVTETNCRCFFEMKKEFEIFVDKVLAAIESESMRREIRENWMSAVRDRCLCANDGVGVEESFDTTNILKCEVRKDQAKDHGARKLNLSNVHGLIGGEWRIFNTLTVRVREE